MTRGAHSRVWCCLGVGFLVGADLGLINEGT